MCEHEHVHKHSHGCHHTHHEEKEIAGIHISYHEEAVIFRMEKEFTLSYGETLQRVRKKLEELSAWVGANGGFVGHIKGYVTDEPHSAMVSIAGSGCNVTESVNPAVRLELICIVFMVDEEEMCKKMGQIFGDIC